MVPKRAVFRHDSVPPEVTSNFNKSRNIKQECFKLFKISLTETFQSKAGKQLTSTSIILDFLPWLLKTFLCESLSHYHHLSSEDQFAGRHCWNDLGFLARARAASAARLSVAVFEELTQLGYIYIYLHLIFLNSSYNQDKITSWFVFPLHVYIYIYIPYIPYCQPFCLEPPEPETIHWKPGKNFFYLKLKKRWMSKWKIWRSKTGGIWEGHRASMSWGRGVEQCLPQEMHESPRSGDFYPFQRCMFDQFFQDVLLCMFWPTQLRQFQECGGWIRVKLHTRLYTGHSPPPHTHTKKNTTTTTLPKNHLFFVGGGTVCIARTFLLLAPPGVVGEECRRSEASGPCGLQSNSR